MRRSSQRGWFTLFLAVLLPVLAVLAASAARSEPLVAALAPESDAAARADAFGGDGPTASEMWPFLDIDHDWTQSGAGLSVARQKQIEGCYSFAEARIERDFAADAIGGADRSLSDQVSGTLRRIRADSGPDRERRLFVGCLAGVER